MKTRPMMMMVDSTRQEVAVVEEQGILFRLDFSTPIPQRVWACRFQTALMEAV